MGGRVEFDDVSTQLLSTKTVHARLSSFKVS